MVGPDRAAPGPEACKAGASTREIMGCISALPLSRDDSLQLLDIARSAIHRTRRSVSRFQRLDGTLLIEQWAEDRGSQKSMQIPEVETGFQPVAMRIVQSTGRPLVTNGYFGVNLIRVAAGEGFPRSYPAWRPPSHSRDGVTIAPRTVC